MRPHPRQPISWGPANIFLVIVPLGLAGVFAAVAALLLGRAGLWAMLYACPAYLVLAAGALYVCRRAAPRPGPIWLGAPAAILGALQASTLIVYIGARAGAPRGGQPLSGSPGGFAALFLALSGAIALVVAIVWTVIVIAVAHDRMGPRVPSRFCAGCRYDRTGLAATAVCPECGTPPAPASSA